MPEAWRIVRTQHLARAFSGEGAEQFGGRWNSRGTRVVYCSSTRALAALETLVHLNPPMNFEWKIIRIEFPENLVTYAPLPLPLDWRTQPPPPSTQKIGDRWVRSAQSALLKVPSVIIPEETNFLLNPAHPDFKKIRIGSPLDFMFDDRLVS